MAVHRLPPRNRPLDASVYAEPFRPVFLTIRAAGGSVPFVDPLLNRRIVDALLRERLRSRCALYAYCLMPNHMHVLVAPLDGGASVLDMLRRFKGAATRIGWRFGLTGRLWQPRYYDSVLCRDSDVDRVVVCILDNPVRRGLAPCPDAYPWGGIVDPMPY